MPDLAQPDRDGLAGIFSVFPKNLPRENGRAGAASTATMYIVDAMIVPGAALLMATLAFYSGMVSFALRPDTGGRMLPIGGLFLLGVFLGGAVFPRLSTWAEQTGSAARRAMPAVWIMMALATVLPGFHHYIFNAPLRLAANLFLGMAVAPAYQLFFSRFPAQWRGTWFGASLGGGLLCWYGLVSLAHAEPRGDGAFHPFLHSVYYVHAAAIAVLTLACVYSLVLWPRATRETEPYFAPRPAARDGQVQIRALALTASAAYLLSGILDAKLTPMLPASPVSASVVFPAVFAAVAATAAGWLLDRRPEMLFRHILPVCCWLFILTPSLAVLGYGHALHGVLQTATAVAQFVLFVICSVAVAGLAPDLRRAVLYACCVYVARLLTVLGHVLWTRVFGFELGITVLAATALAFFLNSRVGKIDFAIAPEGEAAEAARPPAASPGPGVAGEKTAEDRARSFLATAGLTRREEEVAVLLLGGDTTGGIASALGITESTTKKHITSVFRKVGV
ncbi:MAG: helix-turn-helix transcriptional regulator, partial [Planctomycetota bacterium]|nr:helix-turn-helix transcriptional regulator [Planctomycetota bacterium]